MWVSRHCPGGLDASPCPLKGGLLPAFAPGPADGTFDGERDADFPYVLLARCGECAAVLGRERAASRILTWVPEPRGDEGRAEGALAAYRRFRDTTRG